MPVAALVLQWMCSREFKIVPSIMPPDSAKVGFAELLNALDFVGAEFPGVAGNLRNYTPAFILIQENKTAPLPISAPFCRDTRSIHLIVSNAHSQRTTKYMLEK
jgi:hypothetical protein